MIGAPSDATVEDAIVKLTMWVVGGGIEFGPDDVELVIDDWRRLREENFALSANQCHDGYAGEYGDHMCHAVEPAVEAERAACEAIARSYGTDQFADEDCHRIADAIAARKKG